MAERDVDVYVSIGPQEVLAGRLFSHRRRQIESQTFNYSEEYIALPGAYALDPTLPLVSGAHHTAVGREIFGAFSDSAPDRWGRRLIARNERKRVERGGGAARRSGEMDYLLGVRDDLRQGALRMRDPQSEEYFSEPPGGVPSLLELPELLGAAEALEDNAESYEELRALLRGGSSLGGARPKAHVRTADGHLAIAKFPSPSNDEWDVIAWEAVALQLAAAAGLEVPGFRLERIDGKSVLIVDRFDRAGESRVGYVSAMTMLGLTDGDEGSYLEIGELIEKNSPRASADLHELWRRMVLSVLISNLDDHLRNHGFVRSSSSGWQLSPVFDINPDPEPGERFLKTTIDLDDATASVDLLLEVAGQFRLSEEEATEVLGKVINATADWRDRAKAVGLESEIEDLEPAFEHSERVRARELSGR